MYFSVIGVQQHFKPSGMCNKTGLYFSLNVAFTLSYSYLLDVFAGLHILRTYA